VTNYDDMPAGAEMDEAVGRLVMGWELRWDIDQFGKSHGMAFYDKDGEWRDDEAVFSTSAVDALAVLDHLRSDGDVEIIIEADAGGFTVTINYKSANTESSANTLPLAICRAALDFVQWHPLK